MMNPRYSSKLERGSMIQNSKNSSIIVVVVIHAYHQMALALARVAVVRSIS